MAHNASTCGLRLKDYGHFFVGGTMQTGANGTTIGGQMHVQYFVPEDRLHAIPIVMVHGGGGQGLDYLTTPDGRSGWASYFVNRGFSVYVVDRPGHGRALWHEDHSAARATPMSAEIARSLFLAPAQTPDNYGCSKLHTQLAASEAEMDGLIEQFLSGQGCMPIDTERSERDMQRCGTALLDRIGPSVLITHSMGAPFGWLVADQRPSLVKAIVAIEPIGPPFQSPLPGLAPLAWGLTATPMTYDPAVTEPGLLRTMERPPETEGHRPTRLQEEPARKLANLRQIPIALVTAQASFMGDFQQGVHAFLVQAGAKVDHLRLEEHGLLGNGHMMMIERNSDEIAALIDRWLTTSAAIG